MGRPILAAAAFQAAPPRKSRDKLIHQYHGSRLRYSARLLRNRHADRHRLKRIVAVKVLPAAFSANAERMKRLDREAEILASLNHPNIAAIYGLEESDESPALVMELVEGSTSPNVYREDPFRSTKRYRLQDRSPRDSSTRTRRASFIVISSLQM